MQPAYARGVSFYCVRLQRYTFDHPGWMNWFGRFFAMRQLTQWLVCGLLLTVPCLAQVSGNAYLVRMERQTREENVCMLILKDGRYHLERTVAGTPRVFEGSLESSAVPELEPHLNAPQIVDLKQTQIESLPGEDVDQFMITIPRPTGWQKLVFPSGKSRKPFKADLDPILKWLDHNKQQQNPVPSAVPSRCIPPQPVQAAIAAANSSNPFTLRMVVDRYELKGGGTAMSSVSAAHGTTGQTVGGMTNSDAMDPNSFRITRTCAVVYDSGRYRLERSVRESEVVVKSEIYRDTLDKTQIAALRELLDNPKLAAVPSSAAPAFAGRESELTTLAIRRDKAVQMVNVATFAPRNASADLREAALQALGANAGLTNPIRKWVKQNIEDHKSEPLKDVPLDACVPSPQPE